MEAMMGRVAVALMGVMLIFALSGCGSAHAEKSVLSRARDAHEAAPDPGVSVAPQVAALPRVPVEGFPEQPPFETVRRIPHIEGYACSQCHNEPLPVLVARQKQSKEPLSHWQIEMKHAPESVMSCQTCHGNGNMDDLSMLNGKPASYDTPYAVCGQCHGQQVKDWAGGAHGKRLGGWAPPRAVETCTGCHNPHAPGFATRWPAQVSKGGH